MKFELKITVHNTDNDAFEKGNEGVELKRIVDQAIEKWQEGYDDISLKDSNGNGVGRMTVQWKLRQTYTL